MDNEIQSSYRIMKGEEIIMGRFIKVIAERSKPVVDKETQIVKYHKLVKSDVVIKINEIKEVYESVRDDKTYIGLYKGIPICVPDYTVEEIYDMINEAESNNSMNSRMDALEKKIDKLTGLLEKRK